MNFDRLCVKDDLVIPPVDNGVSIRIRGCSIMGDVVVPEDAWSEGRVSILATNIGGEIRTYEVGSESGPDPLDVETIKNKYANDEIGERELERSLDCAFDLNESETEQ